MPAFEIKWTGPKRRRMFRFERQSTGGWLRTERVFRAGQWQTVGQDLVNEPSVEVDADVADAVTTVETPRPSPADD